LRTPLTPIRIWGQMLKRAKDPEQVHRAADVIERNVVLQSRMIDDLLDVNRISQGKVTLDLEVHEVAPLIRAALEASAQDIDEKAIRLTFEDAAEPLPVEGDAGRLQQVFNNILSNAVKFTPREGSIRVTLAREANHTRIVVADTGQGIAPDFLPFVFDIFRQQELGTRREHGGLGIGLALVKRLTELHQGTVSVTSAGAGLGTEVTIRLPLAAETRDRREPMRADVAPRASALAGRSVLVVEDTEDTRESLRALLELHGAKVSIARDGREALDTIQDAAPDLVLCDLRMPRMDGFEFISELHHAPAPVQPPVVAMSGFVSEADRRRTREAGFEGHIAKPCDAEAIVAAVGQAFSHRQGGKARFAPKDASP
jgi:CheY-like chemotaxis protein